MAPEVLYTLLASTTMMGCWLGLRVGIVLGSAGGAAGSTLLLPCALTSYPLATQNTFMQGGFLSSMRPFDLDTACSFGDCVCCTFCCDDLHNIFAG